MCVCVCVCDMCTCVCVHACKRVCMYMRVEGCEKLQTSPCWRSKEGSDKSPLQATGTPVPTRPCDAIFRGHRLPVILQPRSTHPALLVRARRLLAASAQSLRAADFSLQPLTPYNLAPDGHTFETVAIRLLRVSICEWSMDPTCSRKEDQRAQTPERQCSSSSSSIYSQPIRPFAFESSSRSQTEEPHKNGVGPLEWTSDLGDPPCFIGSCKAQGGLLRMASFSKEHDRNVFSCPFYCVK